MADSRVGQATGKAAVATANATATGAKAVAGAGEKVGKGVKDAVTTQSTASAKEITSAQASGMVWVNTDSGIYHKEGAYYGKTKTGKFMTEAAAKTAGYRAAK